MDILILHDRVADDAPPQAQDTLVQVAAVSEALCTRGHNVSTLALTLDLTVLDEWLVREPPDVVFNLVESLGGSDVAATAPVSLLAARGIAFTGSRGPALALSNDKLVAKAHMKALAIPTPAWVSLDEWSAFVPGRYIVKAVAEHASLGIDDTAVVDLADREGAMNAIRRQRDRIGCPCFAEQFVDGREFNLSVLESPTGAVVLPAAEIDFSAFPANKPRVVGYAAKWHDASFEFIHTPRRFSFPAEDATLLAALEHLALRVFRAFHTSGYARVDFRVGAKGPMVLELNTNPCLSPDAGFAAALAEAGIPFVDAIERIVATATGERHFALPAVSSVAGSAGGIRLRSGVREDDPVRVREITAETGFFYPIEVEVAVELADERLSKGEASGYYFVFADDTDGSSLGYASYGPIEMTDGSWDLYWIAVSPAAQGRGVGRLLVDAVERDVKARGGARLYVETAGRPAYEPTRAFYRRCQYIIEGTFDDFYGPGDAKVVFVKRL